MLPQGRYLLQLDRRTLALKSVCPMCASPDLVRWSVRTWRCRACTSVFAEPVRVEGAPTKPYTTRSISDKQERVNARLAQGRVTPNSGAGAIKGDIRAPEMRMECKSTGAASFALKKADLQKIVAQSTGDEIPTFTIEFRGKPGELPQQYVVLQDAWYYQLLECWRARDKNH